MPAFSDFAAPGLELRLDQGDDVSGIREQRRNDRENETQRDERDVNRHDIEGGTIGRQVDWGKRARVDAFDHVDTRIAPHLPVELPVADVERDHMRSAALQQRVCETTGRGPNVQRDAAHHAMPKVSSACASFRPPRPT